jgi:hypothetical protein
VPWVRSFSSLSSHCLAPRYFRMVVSSTPEGFAAIIKATGAKVE